MLATHKEIIPKKGHKSSNVWKEVVRLSQIKPNTVKPSMENTVLTSSYGAVNCVCCHDPSEILPITQPKK